MLNNINLCYICAVFHLLLLNLLPIASNPLIYSLLYIISYTVPIFILFIFFPIHFSKKPVINFSDIFIFFPLMVIASFLLTLFLGSAENSYPLKPSSFLLMGIIAPICEELFWRGSIFRVLKKFGFIPAALISSLLFALMHKGFAGILYAFLSGIIFSYLTYITNSTLSAIILHIINNTVSLLSLSTNYLTLIIVLLSLILGISLKVFVPTKHMPSQYDKASHGAFRMPYLYITTIIFLTFSFLEASFG